MAPAPEPASLHEPGVRPLPVLAAAGEAPDTTETGRSAALHPSQIASLKLFAGGHRTGRLLTELKAGAAAALAGGRHDHLAPARRSCCRDDRDGCDPPDRT
jgi:hypothetical protein